MCKLRFFLVLCLISLGAAAQPAGGHQAMGAQTLTEQQRAQLRLALMKSPQELQAPSSASADSRRQLSVQERADLRQQLRAQRREISAERP